MFPCQKRSWWKCLWPYKWYLVSQELSCCRGHFLPLSLPCAPNLISQLLGDIANWRGSTWRLCPWYTPKKSLSFTSVQTAALLNEKAIHQLLKNSGTEWNCKQDETSVMHEAHTVTVRQLWVSNGETQLKTNTRSKACGSTESLTWGELPGEKPWLETGEVGDWLAGDPALLRYCWSEAYRTTQN